MSTESKEPEDIVEDGVEGGSQTGKAPVAREEGAEVAPKGTGDTEARAASGAAETANEATGPAEEQDERSGDDRGLTTDSSPD